jgi:hypothetical protein
MKALVLFAAAILLVLSAPLGAQEKAADNMEIVRDAVRAEKKVFIAQNMQLTDAESKTFWPVYEQYQDELKKVVDRSITLIQNYAANYEMMTEDGATSMIDEYMAIEEAQIKLRKNYSTRSRNSTWPRRSRW